MNIQRDGLAPNAGRLLWAGFMAILAAGVGFGIRGGIFGELSGSFGLTGAQLGQIGGAGFSGFCFGIIIGGVVCDRVGYGPLVIAAFLFHVLSAVVTFGADPSMDASLAFNLLYWGVFLFALANGTLEAVANPLVATLFPNNRTHYLNILHASWPAGLVLGGAINYFLGDALHWKWQLALFLVPTVIYGLMFVGQKMPRSEASEKGLSFGDMFQDIGVLGGAVVAALLGLFMNSALNIPALYAGIAAFVLFAVSTGMTGFSIGAPLLFVLFLTHGLVGAVELGTDQWIQNITGNLLTEQTGNLLFVYTSFLMFVLRFGADTIEKRIGLSPVGILFVSAVLACIGLLLASTINGVLIAIVALGIYAIGKTFFWPTMLAVASDRYPRTGALAISIMGGIGMMSAGLLGTPGLGYAKDRFAGEVLETNAPAVYAEYAAEKPSGFLFLEEVRGIDGKKLGAINDKLKGAESQEAGRASLSDDERTVLDASITGDRQTLLADAAIPAAMAVIFLLLLLYFRSLGGYKAVHITPEAEQAGGGTKAES